MTSRKEGPGRTALVTGASAGIGAAFARLLAREGFDLVLTARRIERLETLADELQRTHGIMARTIAGDLAQPPSPAMLVDRLQRESIHIDVLINNAGYGLSGRFADWPWEAHRDFIQVMMTAPCELVHRLLPAMVHRGYGRIVNVASVAGLIPGSAGSTLYGASKAFLVSFSEALHREQRTSGVHVSALCPGFTWSEFHDVAGTREQMNRLPKLLWLTAERVAEDGYRAVMRNQAVCIPAMQYRAIVGMLGFMPRSLARALVAR